MAANFETGGPKGQDRDAPHINVPCGVDKDHQAASVFCTDCCLFYCVKCSSKHEIFFSLSWHKMTAVEAMSDEDIEEAMSASNEDKFCARHKQLINCICITCNERICRICSTSQHKNHLHLDLLNVVTEFKNKMDLLTLETKTKYIGNEGNASTEKEKTSQTVRSNVRTAKEAVRKGARQIRDIVAKHEKDLLDSLDRYEKEVLAKLKATQRSPDTFKTFNNEPDSNNTPQAVRLMDAVVRKRLSPTDFQFEERSDTKQVVWKFLFENNGRSEDVVKKMLGSVNLKTYPVKMGTHLQEVKTSNEPTLAVSGMALMGRFLSVTHYSDPNLWLYDLNSEFSQKNAIPGLQDPKGITQLHAMGNNNTVVIVDNHEEFTRLHFVKLATDRGVVGLTHMKSQDVAIQNPRKITLSKKTGEFLIADEKQGRFYICPEDGREPKIITVASDASGLKDTGVYCVLANNDGYITAVHRDNRKEWLIKWIDQSGRPVSTFDCTAQFGQNTPVVLDMVQDSSGRLIVADFACHNLLLLDKAGRFVQHLLTEADGLQSPSCLYLDKEAERLYLAQSDGFWHPTIVRAYKWGRDRGELTCELDVNIAKF